MKQALIDSKSAGGDASAIWNAFEKSGAEGLRNIALNGHMRSISSSVCVMKAVLRSGGDWGADVREGAQEHPDAREAAGSFACPCLILALGLCCLSNHIA